MPLNKAKPFPKRPRLRSFSYRGCYAYLVTIRVYQGQSLFTNGENVHLVAKVLAQVAKEEGFAVIAYCFMPDHVHLMAQGKESSSNLERFVSIFKQRSGYRFKRKMGKRLWQPSYYDRVLRAEESVEAAAEYIVNDPVRKGLVAEPGSYPFSWARGWKG